MFDRFGRSRSMLKPDHSSSGDAPSQKVTNLAPVEMYGVRFGDGSGKAHVTTVFRVGGAWYMDAKNGETWTRELAPVSSWLAKELDSHAVFTKDPPSVPKEDSVDVVGEDV